MFYTRWITPMGDLTEIHKIRRTVFIEEQNCTEKEEFDGTDGKAIHLILFEDDVPAATGRVLFDGDMCYIGRIAVLKEHRGKKYGDLIVRMLIRKAYEMGFEKQYIHAQTQARGFYEKLGFVAYGDEYLECRIPHYSMVREGDISIVCGGH